MSEQELTLQDYQRAVINATCHWDGAELGPIEHYDHSGGFRVKGFAERQWLYAKCLKCGYDWALWKLLDREEPLMPTEHAEKLVRAKADSEHEQAKDFMTKANDVLFGTGPLESAVKRYKKALKDNANKPWKGICVKACWFARRRPCRCRCRRANHQKGFQREIKEFIANLSPLSSSIGGEQT